MTKEQFKVLFKRIEAAWDKEYTDIQFEEWFDSFGNEDFAVAERAFRVMKGESAYPPMVATFHSCLSRTHSEDRASAERQAKEKREAETAKRKPMGDGGWIRFGHYMLENGIKGWWSKERSEVEKLKAEFEKKHPNWQPRKQKQVKRGGMTRIGASMGDVMGNLKKEA